MIPDMIPIGTQYFNARIQPGSRALLLLDAIFLPVILRYNWRLNIPMCMPPWGCTPTKLDILPLIGIRNYVNWLANRRWWDSARSVWIIITIILRGKFSVNGFESKLL